MGLEPIRAVARYPLKIVRLPFRHICLFFITCIILPSSSVIVKGKIHRIVIFSAVFLSCCPNCLLLKENLHLFFSASHPPHLLFPCSFPNTI